MYSKPFGELMFEPAVQLMLILQLHSEADSAQAPTGISIIPSQTGNSSTHCQEKHLRMAAAGQPCLVRDGGFTF